MVRILDFESNLNVLDPNSDEVLTDINVITEFLIKWLKPFQEELKRFEVHNKTENLHELDIKPGEIRKYLRLFYNWLTYLSNTMVFLHETQFILDKEIENSITVTLFNSICNINEIIVLNLGQFTVTPRRKYLKEYVEYTSDKIMKNVFLINEDLLKLWKYLLKVGKEPLKILNGFLKMKFKLKELTNDFTSLLNIHKVKEKSTKLKELLIEFKLNQAFNRLEKAEDSFKEEIWDKTVGDMRLVLEMTVIHLVRVILKDRYWDEPYKQGIQILREKGIVKDEITKKHFCGRDISVYSALSMKGHHADGTSDTNLANSELEARYFMSLTENVIEYLLASFRESGFYESEESDS